MSIVRVRPTGATFGSPEPRGFPSTLDLVLPRGSDSFAGTANQGVYFRSRDGGTISKIAIEVVTASGNVSVAAYRSTGVGRDAVPGTQLATSGAVTCPVAGYAEISLGATANLLPGDWLALSVDNGTATFRGAISSAGNVDLGKGRCYVQSTAHPLPSTPSSLTATIGRNFTLVGVA